jgi:hypothetical protein
MKLCRYAVAILLALTMLASAQDRGSANFMLPTCKGYVDGVPSSPRSTDALTEFFEYGRCFGFVEGLAYTGAFCVPSGVTKNQAMAVVVKYIEARPERTHEPFGKLALEALSAASGLIRYDRRRDSEWPQVAREIITAEKPNFLVMMIGNNDHQTIREKAPPPAPANAQPIQPAPPLPPTPPDLERQPVEQQHPHMTPIELREVSAERREHFDERLKPYGPGISRGFSARENAKKDRTVRNAEDCPQTTPRDFQ